MIRTLGLSQTGTDSQPAYEATPPGVPNSASPQAAKENVKVASSASSRKAREHDNLGGIEENYIRMECWAEEPALYTPTVPLGVFERSLHLFAEDFGENRAAHGASAGLRDVRCTVATGKNAQKRLLDRVRFQ